MLREHRGGTANSPMGSSLNAAQHCRSAAARGNMRNRRIALNAKASVSLLMGCVALSGALPMASFAAGPLAGAGLVALAATGQTGGASAQRASEDLLRESRAAIKRGDYAKAETLIADAEKLGVKYNPLTAQFHDTPDKLRKLLAEERSKANASNKSGFKLPGLFGGGNKAAPAAVPADPTATQAA